MMTTAVNTFALSNISLICRNGTEAVGRLTKSPFLTTTSSPRSDWSPLIVQENNATTPAPRPVTPVRFPQETKNDTSAEAPTASKSCKKRSRTGTVRFSESEDHPELNTNKRRKTEQMRKTFEESDSAFWWTKSEIKNIQKSCALAVRNGESDDDTLERYSLQNQNKRRLARYQMYETIRAVQAFERATQTKAPPELLSQLLQRYSTSKAIEAHTKGLQDMKSMSKSSEQ